MLQTIVLQNASKVIKHIFYLLIHFFFNWYCIAEVNVSCLKDILIFFTEKKRTLEKYS